MARYIEDRSEYTLFVDGSLDSLLPQTSVARTIRAALESLDFALFEERYANDATGRPAVDPRRLAALWILALLRGLSSSVEVARLAGHDLEFRWLLGNAAVEKSTLCDFRTHHVEALRDLSTQILAVLARSGLLPGEAIAVDGTVVRAAASCASTTTRKKLEKTVARLSEAIENKLHEPQAEDGEAEALEKRKARLEAALEEMSALGKTKGEDAYTMTEPEASRKKLKTGGSAPAHNVQAVTDAGTGVIIHTGIVPQGNDCGLLLGQVNDAQAELERVAQRLNEEDGPAVGPIKKASADSAYHDTKQLVELTRERHMSVAVPARPEHRPSGVSDDFLASKFTHDPQSDTMRCPRGNALRRRKFNPDKTALTYPARAGDCAACPFKEQCCPKTTAGRCVNHPLYADVLDAVAQYAASQEGKALLRARWIACEGAFARIIERLNWRRCRTWGAAGARAEALWRQVVHNLMIASGCWEPIMGQAP